MMGLRPEERAVTVAPDASVVEIADLMDEESVGSVVVVDGAGAPLGIVTDRDLAKRVIAAGRDADKTRARDVMTSDVVCMQRGDALPGVIEKARRHAVRRIPVLDKSGRVVTVVSLDNLLFDVAIAIYRLADGARIEVRDAQRAARKRRRHEARDEALDELRTQLRVLTQDARERLREEIAALTGRPAGG